MFVDANILGSKTLYDWLFMLRNASSMYTLLTSHDVLDEAHRVWRQRKPEAGDGMRAARDALFKSQFDEIVTGWTGGPHPSIKDVHDLHVHNAAAFARADMLLTANIGDFGDPDLLPYDLVTPDEFFCLVNAGAPYVVRDVALRQAAYWSARGGRSLQAALEAARCPEFGAVVGEHLRVLAGPDLATTPRPA